MDQLTDDETQEIIYKITPRTKAAIRWLTLAVMSHEKVPYGVTQQEVYEHLAKSVVDATRGPE